MCKTLTSTKNKKNKIKWNETIKLLDASKRLYKFSMTLNGFYLWNYKKFTVFLGLKLLWIVAGQQIYMRVGKQCGNSIHTHKHWMQ